MDTYNVMRFMSVSGSPFFHIGKDEMLLRVKRKKGEVNELEDSILEKIDNERLVKNLKERMNKKQKNIAHLIEIGAVKKTQVFKKFTH